MNLQIGVKVLLRNDEGKLLFLRRAASFKPGPQKWDIPGGRINPEESLKQALEREVREETGLTLKASQRLLAAQDIFAPDAELHVVRLTYIGTASGEVVISDEHDTYAWMSIPEILAEPQVDSYLRTILENYSDLTL